MIKQSRLHRGFAILGSIAALSMTLISSGCLLVDGLHKHTDSQTFSSSGQAADCSAIGTGQTAFENTVHKVMLQNCSSCHGTVFGANDLATAYAAVKSRVDMNNFQASILIVNGSTPNHVGGGCTTCSTALSQQIESAIAKWVPCDAAPAVANPVPAPAPAPSSPPVATVELKCGTGTKNLADYTAKVDPLVSTTCMSCHGGGVAGATAAWSLQNQATPQTRCQVAVSRVDSTTPANSLLLTKAENIVTHSGGKLVTPGTQQATDWLAWITEVGKAK